MSVVEKVPSPFEIATRDLSREARADQGDDRITAWCPTCQERAVPMRNGTCAFCETLLTAVPSTPTVNGSAPTVEESIGGEPEAAALRLGDDLLLPLDAATQSLAILAVKGAGKSNAAAVLAEELFDEGIPWIVVDPKGDWWGIRESVDDTRGLPVAVFGGMHGDLPLSPSSGSAIADLIVDRNLTCVLDVSAMDDEERPEFLAALGERLFERHRLEPSVRHVIVEEANEVVPETRAKDMRATLRAWTRIVCQGRQRGLGITLVSQRSALVSKNVLTQTGSLLVLRTTSPQDRAVIRGWVDFHSVSKEMVDSLPGLSNGEAWIVAPQWLGRVERVRLRRRWTFDSGATPDVVPTRHAQTLDAADIEEIGRLLSGPSEVPPAVEECADPRAVIVKLLAVGPQKRGDLVRATGISAARVRRILHVLAEEGAVVMHGKRAGAVWMKVDGQEPPPASDPEPDAPNEPAAVTTHEPRQLAQRVLAVTHEAERALEDLDAALDEPHEGLTMLRARYLAALLAQIEAGETDESLLDRFERVAGIA